MSITWLRPSEAFLLGIVAGEDDFDSLESFGRALRFHLRPFVPDLRRRPHEILKTLPSDAVTHELHPGIFTSSKFEMILNMENGIFGFPHLADRTTLADLVISHVTAVFEKEAKRKKDGDDEQIDSTLIRNALERLAKKHELDEEFRCGTLVGEYLAHFTNAEREVAYGAQFPYPHASVDLPSTTSFELSRQATLRALLEDSSVLKCPPAFHALGSELSRLADAFPVQEGDDDHEPVGWDEPSVLSEISIGFQIAWLSVGMLFRHLYDAEEAGKSPERLPRQFVTLKNKEHEFRYAFELAQEELYAAEKRFTPGEVIAHLVMGIEPLTRRLAGELGSIKKWPQIRERVASVHGAEGVRFAEIADCLYGVYRNPNAHDGPLLVAGFYQTWSDAFFVFSGCKKLLEIADSLDRQMQAKGK